MKKLYFLIVILLTILVCYQPDGKVKAVTYRQDQLGNWHFDYVSKLDESYYDGLTGTGAVFVNKLNEIISANLKKYSYSSGTRAQLLKLDETPGDPTTVFLLYSGGVADKGVSGNEVSQEHVWAKSHGFPGGSTYENGYAYADLHHLRLVKQSINTRRNNSDFDNLDHTTATFVEGNYYTGNTFEPRDGAKGDVARMLFYMDVRYDGGLSPDGKNDPNLTLVDHYTSSSEGNGELGFLSTLLEWNDLDPVDDFERRRNDMLEEIAGNRNPFIDHPEFVAQVYEHDTVSNLTPEEKLTLLITTIDEIGTVTLESINSIVLAETLYASLTTAYQNLVTNYQILLDARAAYNILRETQLGYSVDFSSFAFGNSYETEIEVSVSGKPWYLSSAYRLTARLGYNQINEVNSLVGTNFYQGTTLGSYMVMEWDYANMTKVSLSYGSSYGMVTRYLLYASYDGGNTYEIIATKTSELSNSMIEAVFMQPKTARIAFVIEGYDNTTNNNNAPRVDLGTFTISSGDVTFADEIETVNTENSMKFVYFEEDGLYSLEDNSMGLRFSVTITKEMYDRMLTFDSTPTFGVVVGIADYFEGLISIGDPNANTVYTDIVRSNEFNQEDPEGNYYQFCLLIEEIDPADFDTLLVGRGFVELDGEVLYFKERLMSVTDLAKAYLALNNEAIEPYRGVLTYIANNLNNKENSEFGKKEPGDTEIPYATVFGG